jgi:hypothetical protein
MQLPLNVSPVSASFVGLQRLGIPRVLFLACVAHMRSAVFSVACLGKIEVIILKFGCKCATFCDARVICHNFLGLSTVCQVKFNELARD